MKIEILFSFAICSLLLLNCKRPKPRAPIHVDHVRPAAASVRISKAIYTAERKALQAYGKQLGLRFKSSDLDFWYALVGSAQDRSAARSPHPSDVLSISYSISDAHGKPIYATRQERVRLDHQELIYGLNEGIKLLKAGDSAIFLIPSHLAFGFHGDGHAIPPNTPLVVKLKLKQINRNL